MHSFLKRRPKGRGGEIDPDEILIDSSNLPEYDTTQFEGRLEKAISRSSLFAVAGVFFLIAVLFLVQSARLQLIHGEEYRIRSENNLLRPVPIFAGRGVIYDRNGKLLAWNAPAVGPLEGSVAKRQYATTTGLAHILGYVQYPSKDKNGFYYREDFEGVAGAEKDYNDSLQGQAGSRLVEVNARGDLISESTVRPPQNGANLNLSIDSRLQSALYDDLRDIAKRVGFTGGAAVIMDVRTGEIVALTSYPEYNSQVMSDRNNSALIQATLNDKSLPFLDRAIDGLYTPGSIVKPYIALGVLTEKVIDPNKIVVTTGSISIPNPYDPTKSTLFRDWKNLGSLDLRHAIAMSSDAYFYTVGGGYEGQKGLGIANIDKYLRMFGFGSTTLSGDQSLLLSRAGTIPTPEWKKKTFNENWFVGDTYHTAIGQYGFQVTLVQIVRAVAAIANDGKLLIPTMIKGEEEKIDFIVPIPAENFDIVREGMRLSVQIGTCVALKVPYVNIAGKSGTAELGVSKENVNSWITGFWPYENPHYAFVAMLEKGSVHNLIGAAAAMRQTLDWMSVNTPEYF